MSIVLYFQVPVCREMEKLGNRMKLWHITDRCSQKKSCEKYKIVFTALFINLQFLYPSKVITIGTTATNSTVLMVTTLVENSTSPSP